MTTRKALLIPLILGAAILGYIPSPASAGTITVGFFVPSRLDPTIVTFTNGNPVTVSAAALAPFSGAGLEIHSQVRAMGSTGPYEDITSLAFHFRYNGVVDFTTASPIGFAPWIETQTRQGNLWDVTFTSDVKSARINDNAFQLNNQQWALATITGAVSDLTDFRALNANGITITPTVSPQLTPEGDSLLLLSCGILPLAAAGLWRRRRCITA